jgi:hypothetical protein
LFSPTSVLNKTLHIKAAFYFACMQTVCQFCGTPSSLVHVHGHYQCSACGINALPCCDGDNCDTNVQLTVQLAAERISKEVTPDKE